MPLPLGTLIASGNRCPITGRWQSLSTPPVTEDFKEGQSVPLHAGKATYWKLVYKPKKRDRGSSPLQG